MANQCSLHSDYFKEDAVILPMFEGALFRSQYPEWEPAYYVHHAT